LNSNGPTIVVERVSRRYGKVEALREVSLQVEQGSVLGLLGPNGAGKTTLVKILSSLIKPSGGRATVAGFDVVQQTRQVRSIIGLAGQSAAVDENLSGRENLKLVARLYHMSRGDSERRAGELLEQFDLVESGDRMARTYSGGMRRRLDLAASLIAKPQVLFLDEPTTGLDPRSRNDLWDVIRGLVRSGTTVLLTTQYLEEADQLADRISVIDHGSLIAEGTATELKRRAGSEFISVQVANAEHVSRAQATLARFSEDTPVITGHDRRVTVSVTDGSSMLAGVVRELDTAEIAISDLSLRQPTLDDVFLALTGHRATVSETADNDGGSGDD
jgi:ABC-2 type transport system ATP-binding protein